MHVKTIPRSLRSAKPPSHVNTRTQTYMCTSVFFFQHWSITNDPARNAQHLTWLRSLIIHFISDLYDRVCHDLSIQEVSSWKTIDTLFEETRKILEMSEILCILFTERKELESSWINKNVFCYHLCYYFVIYVRAEVGNLSHMLNFNPTVGALRLFGGCIDIYIRVRSSMTREYAESLAKTLILY